jgi:hypothetical protein
LDRGVHFAQLARETLQRTGGGQFTCRIELSIVGFVESLQGRLADIPDKFERICQEGIADGDWEYAVLSANNVLMFGVGTARSLDELGETAERLVATCAGLGHRRLFADLRLHAQMIESLRGSAPDAGLLSGRQSLGTGSCCRRCRTGSFFRRWGSGGATQHMLFQCFKLFHDQVLVHEPKRAH